MTLNPHFPLKKVIWSLLMIRFDISFFSKLNLKCQGFFLHDHIALYILIRKMQYIFLHLLASEGMQCSMLEHVLMWVSVTFRVAPYNSTELPWTCVILEGHFKTDLACCPLFTETSSSMRTLGMAVFKQQKVEDFYDIGEELGRWVIWLVAWGCLIIASCFCLLLTSWWAAWRIFTGQVKIWWARRKVFPYNLTSH